ncbi:MAG: tol-pal system YbgF family protein [Gemmatimonadales bacterium]
MRSDGYLDWLYSGNGAGLAVAAITASVAGIVFQAPLTLVLIAAGGSFVLGKVVVLTLAGTSGRAAQSVYAPAAAGGYAHTHSNIDAMEARGDFGGAAAAWEAVSVSEPKNPWPLIRAGELYLRELGEPATALERFRLARATPGLTPEQHRYVTQKMIDLYLGPLADEGRALAELRRLADAHPGTREAEGARAAIRRLKEQRPTRP